ncbi:MAG: hypothetical protein ACRDJG_06185 [Actinomycetota bacterium]
MRKQMRKHKRILAVVGLAIVAGVVFNELRIQRTEREIPRPETGPPVTGMLISKTEIMGLPASGAAWETMKKDADRIPAVHPGKQNNRGCAHLMAAGLVSQRVGTSSYQAAVRDELVAITSIGYNRPNATLALGRNLLACVVAADLIDLRSFDPQANATFVRWLADIRRRELPDAHDRWTSLTTTCENSANNWGTSACASLLAVHSYLGDRAGVNRVWDLFQAWVGDRGKYPEDGLGERGYFQPTGSWDASYFCGGRSRWVAVNPTGCAARGGYNLDGGLGEELSRSRRSCCPPDKSGLSYDFAGLRGALGTAELLWRQGFDVFSSGNQGLRRAMEYLCRNDQCTPLRRSVNAWLGHAINFHYGTSFPEEAISGDPGYNLSYGDWLWGRDRTELRIQTEDPAEIREEPSAGRSSTPARHQR